MKSKTMGAYWLLLTVVLPVCWSQSSYAQGADLKKEKPLSEKVARTVEKIIPAIRQRNENEFLQLSMPLIKSSNPEQLEVIDQMCLDRGVATVTELFAELVIEKIQQGIDPVSATSNRQMARVVLHGIEDDLEALEQSLAKQDVQHGGLQDALEVPADFHESEKMFWDIHVLHNEFDNATQKLQLANALLKRHKKAFRREGEGEALVARFTEIEKRLEVQYGKIAERAAELRLKRLTAAYRVLTDEDNDDKFELLLTSAMALEQDARVLEKFFKDNDSISSEALGDINLPGEINGMLAGGRKTHGEVMKKANLFRNGLHYWVRGRYGAGSFARGLVKTPQASSSLQAMEMLSMPKMRDKPISKYHSEEETTPGYDRRHYRSWAAEYRPIVGAEKGSTYSEEYSKSSTKTTEWRADRFI